jgi:scyllo-inositol 2-dehydrogenase (NADP+)
VAIGVGLIGYGLAGRFLHAPFLAPAGFSLSAVATSRAAEVEADYPQATVVADPQAIFDRPDVEVVIVAAPNDVHFSLAERALEAGKHVVVDKPMAATVLEADLLLDRARQSGRALTVYQNRRWDGDFLTVRDLLASDRLGGAVLLESAFDRYRPDVQTRWREEPARGGGLLLDLGPHLVDQALQLFGWPDWVQGDVMRQRIGARVDDGFAIRLAFGRLRVVLEASSLAAAARPRFRVFGEKASFVKHGLDSQEAQLRSGRLPTDPGFGGEPEGARGEITTGSMPTGVPTPGRAGHWMAFWTGLERALRGASAPPVDPVEARDALHVIECARESSDVGRRLTPARPRSARYAGA